MRKIYSQLAGFLNLYCVIISIGGPSDCHVDTMVQVFDVRPIVGHSHRAERPGVAFLHAANRTAHLHEQHTAL